MGKFKIFLLVIGTAFLIASCGSSSTTAAIGGIALANEVQVL